MSRRRAPALRSTSTGASRSNRFKDQPIDVEALECIELFASLLVRFQFPRAKAVEHFADCMQRLPPELGVYTATDDDFPGNIYVPAEVLTRWYGLREYVGPDGQPKPLSLRGRGYTFSSLVYGIDPNADAEQVLTYLIKIRAVAQVGNRYAARQRKALHRITTRTLRTFNFKATLALLRAAERNVREGRPLEYQTATYGSVPQSGLDDFRAAMSRLADTTLVSADEAMLRETNSSPAGSRAVPLTFGAYLSETRPLRSLLAKRPQASTRKKAPR